MRFYIKTISFLSFLLMLPVKAVSSDEIIYKASEIPANLLINSKAVVRSSETVFEITDINKAVKKVSYVLTILNENGIENSVLIEFYNKYLSVNKIHYDLYDKDGNPVKNGLNVQVEDYSANTGYSLYEDNRVKFLDPKCRTTPFTIKYTYEIKYDGLLFYPEWRVYNDYNISVESSTFTVITPKGFKFRYLEKNIDNQCIISEDQYKIKYCWKYDNMPAIRNESFSTSLNDFSPVVLTAPSDFEIGGYKGNLDTWKNFGDWIYSLGKDRNILDPETNKKILSLVSGVGDDIEKIKILYEYLQNKVRYVSVQIGIGGWQPIEAEDVNRVSYGDCKALSNYMKSLLDVVGVKSYYTLVRAGEYAPQVNSDFPSSQFNHAILCVPIQNSDTIWLECTSQNIPFGYMGTFTDDRKVLLISEEGGTLVNSKRYSIDDNQQIRNIKVNLETNGTASLTIQTDYKGTFYDKIYRVLQLDDIDRKKFILSKIPSQGFNLVNYSFLETKNIIPQIKENLNLKHSGLGTFMGNRILIKPNIVTRIETPPYKTKDRKSDVSIRRAYCTIDTILYSIPKGYIIDKIPEQISVSTKFGEYSSEILPDKEGFIYVRIFRLLKGSYPVSDYQEFIDFFEKVSVSDERKISVVKNL